jgi:hypothetical protein
MGAWSWLKNFSSAQIHIFVNPGALVPTSPHCCSSVSLPDPLWSLPYYSWTSYSQALGHYPSSREKTEATRGLGLPLEHSSPPFSLSSLHLTWLPSRSPATCFKTTKSSGHASSFMITQKYFLCWPLLPAYTSVISCVLLFYSPSFSLPHVQFWSTSEAKTPTSIHTLYPPNLQPRPHPQLSYHLYCIRLFVVVVLS